MADFFYAHHEAAAAAATQIAEGDRTKQFVFLEEDGTPSFTEVDTQAVLANADKVDPKTLALAQNLVQLSARERLVVCGDLRCMKVTMKAQ